MGEVRYREWRPAPVLEEFVACYWYYARRFDPAGVEQVLPDGFIELVVQIGAPYRHQGRPLPGVVVIGLLDESLQLEATEWVEQWCVRFRPWGWHRSVTCADSGSGRGAPPVTSSPLG